MRTAVGALVLGAFGWTLTTACASDEDARAPFTEADASADAARDGAADGSFGVDDAGTCPPRTPAQPVTTKPPRPFEAGACTTAQVAGYVSECVNADGNKCTAYKQANPTCAACVESTSADATWGPIVFYENRRFYDYNYGGCIANVTDDAAENGCGAAQTRYLECRHAACVACLPSTLPLDYEPFFACQGAKAVEQVCATELAAAQTSCADYFATKPTDACQGAGLPPEEYLRRLVTAWCAGAPNDAGADGGDAGDGG